MHLTVGNNDNRVLLFYEEVLGTAELDNHVVAFLCIESSRGNIDPSGHWRKTVLGVNTCTYLNIKQWLLPSEMMQ